MAFLIFPRAATLGAMSNKKWFSPDGFGKPMAIGLVPNMGRFDPQGGSDGDAFVITIAAKPESTACCI